MGIKATFGQCPKVSGFFPISSLRVNASIVAYDIFPRNTQEIEGRQADVQLVIEGASSYISEMNSTSVYVDQRSQVTFGDYIVSMYKNKTRDIRS